MVEDTVAAAEAMVVRHTAVSRPPMAAAAAAAVGARRPAEARQPAMVLGHPAADGRKAVELPAQLYDMARPPPSRTPKVHEALASRSREVRRVLRRPTLTVVALASSWGLVQRSVDGKREVLIG